MNFLLENTNKILFLAIIVFTIQSCIDDDEDLVVDDGSEELLLNYGFVAGQGEWKTGFSEHPLLAADTMQIDADIVIFNSLSSDSLLKLSAIDPVGDMFSFMKLQVTGLSPLTVYDVLVETEFAALNLDSAGTTYQEQQLVHLKVGVFEDEPILIPAADSVSRGYSYEVLDINKGNDDDPGSDMVLLGTVVMPNPQLFTQFLRGVNTGNELRGRSDADGNMWLLIGMDSETRMHQAFYYRYVAALYTEVL